VYGILTALRLDTPGEGGLEEKEEKAIEQSSMVRVWTRVIVRVFLMLAAVVAGLWLLYQLSTVLLLLIISIFFCYLIAPLVRIVEQPVYLGSREIKLPRGLAIFAVYIVIGLVLVLAIQLLSPLISDQVDVLKAQWPAYQKSVTSTFNDVTNWTRHLRLPQQWREDLQERTVHVMESVGNWLGGFLWASVSYLTYLLWLILVPIFSFFLLKDAGRIEHGLVALLPNERLRKRMHWLLLDVSRTLAAYIRAQITACAEIAVLVTIGLSIIGSPIAIVLGLIAGLLEFLPMIGPLSFAVLAFVLTVTVSLKKALLVLGFLAVLRIAQDYIIYPRIVGHGIEMHPLVVILAILSGAELGGLVGVFLSIPFVGLMIVVYNHFIAYRSLQGQGGPVPAAQFERELQRDPAPDLPPAPVAPALEK
jgi:predicted PurR-regulated permease PerM